MSDNQPVIKVTQINKGCGSSCSSGCLWIIIGLIFLFYLLPSINKSDSKKSTRLSETPDFLEKNHVSPTMSSTQDDFIEMRAEIENRDLTDIQRKEAIERHIGELVTWKGWIEDVEKNENTYRICIDMDKPEIIFSVYDLVIEVDKSIAHRLKKDQAVYINGSIKSIDIKSGFFNVELNNPQISTQQPDTF